MGSVFHVFFMGGLIVIYLISIMVLKPFRVHRKRRISTISLKLSYLLFLLFFFIFTYLLLFGHKITNAIGTAYDSIFNIHFLIFVSASIVPNVGVMLRRRIKRKRVEYNYMFTAVNALYSLHLLFLIASQKWAIF